MPSRRRRLDQANDHGLDVALRLDGLEAQLLRKVTRDFESEDEPHVVRDWRWLGSAGYSDPGCNLRRKHGGTALRYSLEEQFGLIATPCRWCASPPTHLRNAWIIASFRDAV